LKKTIYPDTNFVLFTYDQAGRRTKIKDPRGYETTFAYDAAYRLTSETNADAKVTSYAYDPMSNLTGVTDALNRTTNYTYDEFERLTKVKYPEATAGAGRLEENFTYDSAGNLLQKTDQAGRITSFCYDNADRLTSTIDPAQKNTTYEYNARSQITAVIDAINQRYEFVYDVLGSRTQEKKGTATMSFGYDAAGNMSQRTDYNGAVTNYLYDALNRLTTISYPGTPSATYGYDVLSRLTTAANPTGTVAIAYDNRSRVSSVTDVFGQVVSYDYDANSNRTQLSLNGATSASYQYDVINRLTQLTDNASLNTTFAYDPTNKLTARSLPNGVATSYQYDGLDRLTRLTHSKGANTLADFQYQFNAVGNITQMTDGAGASNYSYDPLDRLTAATHPNQSNESYTLDDVGNRTASQQGSSYSYQAFNRLVGANGASFGYDANGSLSSKTDASGSWTYSWDHENRLKQASKASGVTVSYAYDALGRRVQRTSTTEGTTKFVYDGADVMRDLDDNGVTVADYLNAPGIDNKLRQSASGTVSYFVTDHLGTTRAFTDASGTLTSSLTYDSFGNVVSGSAATRYTYTGREFDSETGLMYYRARWYDPREGKFVSEDPIGLEGGLNFYSYVDHSPTLFSDPTGLQKTSPWNSWPPQKPLKSWTCEELIQGIWEAVDTLKKRASDLIYDPQNLQWYHWTIPHPRFGSVQGHRQQYEGWRSRLDEQLKKWYDKCKDKGGPQPPCEAKEWAKTPAPVPVIRESPEERRLREKADYHRNIAIGVGAAGAFALGGVVVVGGATGALIGALAF
jgi:RHS repeat-associated protein